MEAQFERQQKEGCSKSGGPEYSKGTPWQLSQAGISDPHDFKKDFTGLKDADPQLRYLRMQRWIDCYKGSRPVRQAWAKRWYRTFMVTTIMIIQTYIRIVGDAIPIRAIHEEVNIPNSRAKLLKARRAEPASDGWWDWGTEPTTIDADNPDEGINAMLRKYRPSFPAIAKHKGDGVDIYVEIVMRYSDREDPRGLCLSPDTVSLIGELGGALDIDFVPLVETHPF
jgi:hypothetical protein